MNLRKTIIALMTLVFMFLLSGCWDSIEINKRAFVLGIGIDKGENPNEVSTTYEIALPAKIAKPGGGDEGKDSEGGTSTWDITKSAPSIQEANNTMHENIDRVMDLEHMQLLVLGGDISKEGIYNHVDFLFREPQMRRRTKVVYTDGKASDILKVEPKTTKSPSVFLADILNTNQKYTHTIARALDLGELVQNIRDGFDYAIVRTKVIDKQVKIDGAAAFRDNKFVVNIDEGEIETLEWVMGRTTRGNVRIPMPNSPSNLIIFEIAGGSGKITPVFSGDRVDFKLELNVEGDIAEKQDTNYLNTLEEPYIEAVQNAIEEKMKEEIVQAFNKYEKQYMVDVFQLQRKIKNYNIKFYDKNKNRLHEILAASNINVKIDAKVRRIGLTK